MKPLTTRKLLAIALGVGGFLIVNAVALLAAFLLAPEGIAIMTTVIGADLVIIQNVVNFYFQESDADLLPPAPPPAEDAE